MRYIIPAAIGIAVSLVVLVGTFVPQQTLLAARLLFVDWAVILGGLAVLLGVLNLLLVNVRRTQSRETGSAYGLLTALALVTTLGVGVLEGVSGGQAGLYEPGQITNVLFRGVVAPSLAALTGLITVFLIVAAVRLMRTRPDGWSALFLGAAVVVLVGWVPLGAAFAGRFRDWVLRVPAAAGARGILLGTALGIVLIGLRFLTGAERPYKD